MSSAVQLQLNRWVASLRRDELKSLLVRGSGGAFAVSISGQVIRFLVLAALARVLGGESYGKYIYVLSWFHIVLLVSKMGLDHSAMRFVSEYHATERWSLCAGFLRWGRRTALRNSLIVSGVGAAVMLTVRDRIGWELALTAVAACCALPLVTILGVGRASLLGLKDPVRANLPEAVIQPIALAGTVGLLVLVLGTPITAPSAFTAYCVASGVALAINWRWLKSKLSARVVSAAPTFSRTEWASLAMPLFLIAGMTMIQAETDTLMIGAILGTTEAGIYKTACQAAHLPAIGLAAVNTVMAPLIAQLYAEKRLGELQHLVTFSAQVISVVGITASLLVIATGKHILAVFGPEFHIGYAALVILSLGQMFGTLSGAVRYLMTMTGGHNTAMRVFASTMVLNIVLNAAFIPTLGTRGAALATAVSTATWNVLLVAFVWKRIRIWSPAIARPLGP